MVEADGEAMQKGWNIAGSPDTIADLKNGLGDGQKVADARSLALRNKLPFR